MRVPTLSGNLPIVDEQGRPSAAFVQWWGNSVRQIVSQIDSQATLIANLQATQADLAATEASLTTTVANLTAAQAAITSINGDIANLVVKNAAARPSYTAYAGQTVSNPPTQAQMQALDNAVVALANAYTGLAAALHTANVLT